MIANLILSTIGLFTLAMILVGILGDPDAKRRRACRRIMDRNRARYRRNAERIKDHYHDK